jgi:hypothetical protein
MRKRWTSAEDSRLRAMVAARLTAAQAGVALGRTTDGVWCRMCRLRLRSQQNPNVSGSPHQRSRGRRG